MSVQKKATPAAKPTTHRPPKKLIPRPAPKATPATAENPEQVVAPEVVAPTVSATAAATATARPPRKPSRVDETVARHQKVLADALVQAQAIKYDQPRVVKAGAPAGKKSEKPAKARKVKLVRDSYAMPEAEFAQIAGLKKHLAGLGHEAKKSDLLRAGVALLAALNDAELLAVMGRVERIKTGRPAK